MFTFGLFVYVPTRAEAEDIIHFYHFKKISFICCSAGAVLEDPHTVVSSSEESPEGAPCRRHRRRRRAVAACLIELPPCLLT
jgi:hypothetical protein